MTSPKHLVDLALDLGRQAATELDSSQEKARTLAAVSCALSFAAFASAIIKRRDDGGDEIDVLERAIAAGALADAERKRP